LAAIGHDVLVPDTGLYTDCLFGKAAPRMMELRRDLRDITAADMEGFNAVVDLAALSNDPFGEPQLRMALDVVHDAVECGRVLSGVDAYTRDCLALEVDTSFASHR
jgi:hypothetical protein